MLRLNSIIAIFLLATGCVDNSEMNEVEVTQGTGGSILFCRPSSIMRIAEAINLYVDGEQVAQIRNGSRGSIPIELNQNYRFGLEPSAIFMRVSVQTAYEGRASHKEDRYFIVAGKANVDQGIAVWAGGIIGAAELDRVQDTGKENWRVVPVSRSAFENSCQ